MHPHVLHPRTGVGQRSPGCAAVNGWRCWVAVLPNTGSSGRYAVTIPTRSPMGHPGLLVTLVEGSDHPCWCERRRSSFNPRPPETVSPPSAITRA